METFECPRCGSGNIEILVGDNCDDTLLCTDCGFDKFALGTEPDENIPAADSGR